MKWTSSIAFLVALLVAGAGAVALAEPKPSQHPRTGQLAALEFAPGSSELAIEIDGAIAEKVDAAASWAQAHPDGLVVLDGHADPTGTRSFNVQLSLRRAKAVRERLVVAGVNPEQIVIAAFGADGPRPDRTVVIWATRTGHQAATARAW